jgi:hypothetical protein
MTYSSAPDFRSAGYELIITNATPTDNQTKSGGVVRQHNKVSFSRVFDAGHAAGAYQPETVSRIFDRVMFDKDVATGSIDTSANASKGYSSTGPPSSFGIKNVLPVELKNQCYLWNALVTCTEEELAALMNGTAVIKDFILLLE